MIKLINYLNNKINDHLNHQFPWLSSRKKLICLIILDLLTYFISITFVINKSILKISNVSTILFLFISFWIIISYVLGKYHIKNKFEPKILFKLLFISYLPTISFYLIFKFIFNYFSFIFQNINNFFVINEIIFSFTFSTIIINFILYLIFSKIKKHQSHWLYYGSDEKFEYLKKELLITKYKGEIIKCEIDSINPFFDINKYEGLIIDNSILNKQQINNIIDILPKDIKIELILNWSGKFLQRYPYLLSEEIIFDKLSKRKSNSNHIQIRIKRIADIFLSSLILLISSPIIFISCIAIFLEDQGPFFYAQERSGLNGKKIKIYKLRSMKVKAEKNGPQWAKVNDQRITKIGNLVRLTRLDELPQLISVIKGDMSLIGPRPERLELEKKFGLISPVYLLRYSVTPGLSGWAQVNFRYGASASDAITKLSYDLYYAENFSIWLDLLIFFKTIRLVFSCKGSVPENNS